MILTIITVSGYIVKQILTNKLRRISAKKLDTTRVLLNKVYIDVLV